MGDFLRDLQFSARMLIKNPMFTVAAVTTLALGIGLNAATFSAVHGLLLRPLPGAEAPEELVQLYREYPGIAFGSNSIPHFQDIRDRSSEVFESVAAYYFTDVSLSADGRSERIMGMAVSANFFQTYGAEPMLGRAFIPGEEDRDPGAHAVAILGHAFWQTRFGEDPGVVGSTLRLNGHTFEIEGIAPPDFAGPVTYAAVPIYVPLMMQREIEPGSNRIESRGNNNMNAIGRLRDGQTLERAQQVFESILLQLREEYPDHYTRQTGTRMVPQNEAGIHPNFAAAQIGMSAVIMAVVGLLLLIACVNVANLFLARARSTSRDEHSAQPRRGSPPHPSAVADGELDVQRPGRARSRELHDQPLGQRALTNRRPFGCSMWRSTARCSGSPWRSPWRLESFSGCCRHCRRLVPRRSPR
jgi:hypothetical protein